MATSQRALDQVRSILNKLDRDIDAARARRLHDPATGPIGAGPQSAPPPVIAPQSSLQVGAGTGAGVAPRPALATNAPGPVPAKVPLPGGLGAQAPANNPRSPFGRAQPMRATRPPLTGT